MPPSIFPLGLGYIASTLIENNHSVKILDLNGKRLKNEAVVEELAADQYDLVGISGIITQYKKIKEITQLIKNQYPDIPVVLGGAGPTSTPTLFLNHTSCDYVCIGEGEKVILDIINYLQGNINLNDFKGIAYKSEDQIVYTEKQDTIKDLDTLSFPAWQLFDSMEIYVKNFLFRFDKPTGMNIMTSRGCPGRCVYCLNHFGHRIRNRSSDSIMQEIMLLIKLYKIQHVHFIDDTFVASKKVARELCNRIIKEDLGITWSTNARVDQVNEDILKLMASSGCISVAYGVESGSPKILKEMRKGFRLEQAKRAIQLTRKVGIDCKAYFIIGMPGETEDTIKETVDFCKESLVGGEFFFATPFPQTELWDYAISNHMIKNEEAYIELVGEVRDFIINLTQFKDEKLFSLKEKAENEIQEHLKSNEVKFKVGTRQDPRETAKHLPEF